jgi:hypothetical protein
VKLPDGSDGFTFVRLRYAPQASRIFAAERARLRRPVTERLAVDGVATRVTHTPFDLGTAPMLFDGDTYTLARTADANAMVVELDFERPRPLTSVRVVGRDMALGVQLRVDASGRTSALRYEDAEDRFQEAPAIGFTLGARAVLVTRLVLRVFDPIKPDETHIHVREIELR